MRKKIEMQQCINKVHLLQDGTAESKKLLKDNQQEDFWHRIKSGAQSIYAQSTLVLWRQGSE